MAKKNLKMIKHVILLGILSGLFNSQAIASNAKEIFPNTQNLQKIDQCITVTDSCSFDGTQICKTTYCGNQIKNLYLKNFVKEHKLKGRKFPSLFDLEAYIKKHAPPELKGMTVHFSYKKNVSDNYSSKRITVLLDSKDYISDVIIG